MKASSPAATQLTASPISAVAPADSTMPRPSAAPGSTRPAGIGRARVRVITASMSRSYHMLMAAAPPAPMAMQSTATRAITGWMAPGAIARPTAPVNTTSDITRGFSSASASASATGAAPCATAALAAGSLIGRRPRSRP